MATIDRGDEDVAAYALHELGHLVVGGDPDHQQELEGPGLALDYAHFRHVKSPRWSHFMRDFVVHATDGTEWKELTSAEKRSLIGTSRAVAIRAGLLTPSGDLTFRLGGAA